MTVASRIAQATEGFRGGGFTEQTISSLFAGEVEIITMVTAEVQKEVQATVERVITAEVVKTVDAEVCS